MLVYIVATVLSVVLAWISTRIKTDTTEKKLIAKGIAFLSAMPLFCVAAFRYNVGTDYPFTYTYRFNLRVQGQDLSEIFEFGFIKLMDIIILFTDNSYWLFIVCSAIFSFFTFKSIYKQSNNIPFSILILVIGCFYFASLNLMRNYMALAIVLYAFKYIRTRDIKRYTIFILIAFSLHKSVILLYPIYFLYNIKLSNKSIIGIIAMATLFLPIWDKIFEYIISFTDYNWYYIYKENNITVLTSMIIINAILMLLYACYYKDNKEDKLYKIYMKIQMIILIISIFSIILPMTRRLILIFNFIQILSIPYIISRVKNKNIRIIIGILIIGVISFVTFRQITAQEMHQVLPYQTIFRVI